MSDNFKNMAALDNVQRVVDDANQALNNPNSGIKDSAISEVLAGALGAGAGGGIGFAALYGLGTVGLSAAGMTSALATAGALVGGGMAAGVAVLAAPAVLLGGGAIWLASKRNAKRLLERKESLFQQALKARDAVLRELNDCVGKSQDRIDRLNALNALLQRAVQELKQDLGRS